MIIATDALMIAKVAEILPQFVDRLVYGTPVFAQKEWTYYNEKLPGVAALPWCWLLS